HRQSATWWYDALLVGAYAWSGCLLAVVSLQTMQTLMRNVVGQTASWLFVVLVAGLSGIGVYMGRVLRWNSWDLLFSPHDVLADMLVWVIDPLGHARPLGMMLLISAFVLVCYGAFLSAHRPTAPAIVRRYSRSGR